MVEYKKDEIRNEVHDWVLELYKEGYEYQAIILLLATWNFAYFRYVLTSLNLKEFKRKLRRLKETDFKFFENKAFESIDLNNQRTIESIKNIYTTLSDSGIKQVGATKVMYLLNPKVFVMWDNGIITHYHKKFKNDRSVGKLDKTAEGYVNFMKLMQKLYAKKKFPQPKGETTIPRAIDLFNWEHYRTNKKTKAGSLHHHRVL